MNEVEVMGRSISSVKLPEGAWDRTLPGRFGDLYRSLLTQGLQEFPPIEGYETMHVMLMERAAYFFCKQKADENDPIQSFELKRYKANFIAFIKVCDAMLKEARSISAEAAFKHNFVRQVVEVIDRVIADPDLKRTIVRELGKIASQ